MPVSRPVLSSGDFFPEWPPTSALVGDLSGVNRAITTDAGVQQNPSITADPTNPQRVVAAYMDYALRDTGYAGIGVAASADGGDTWLLSSIPLPAGFDQRSLGPRRQV